MQRRTFLSLLAIPAVASLLQACGDDSTGTRPADETTGSTPDTRPDRSPDGGLQPASLMGKAPRVAATSADAFEASAAINAFSADLFAQLIAADPTANLVFSPASIALALTMTSAGAKGDTLAEMSKVLHLTDPGMIHRSMNGLTVGLAELDQSQDNTTQGGTGTSEVQLSIANSLWGQTGFDFEQAFLDLLSSEYGAGMELVDYVTDPEAARVAINAWVAEQTKQRIPELLGPDTITKDARLTLVNAIYLKANWATVFPDGNTAEAPFTTPTGEVRVQMMQVSNDFGYAEGAGWQAVELPYVFGNLTFVAFVGTDDDSLLTTGDEVFAALDRRPVTLSMPRFDIQTSTSLADVLAAMGMPTAFSAKADFSGMTKQVALAIGDVVHQANITVDEQGTEAAAATAVIVMPTSEQVVEEPIEMLVDRPFTFWLRDRATGTIIFTGRVNDPSATRG
ncbi:MAG: serpin family protein [Ilumatobacteraceae bacterium]